MLLWVPCAPPQRNSDTPHEGMRPVRLSTSEIHWGPPCLLRQARCTKILHEGGSPGHSAALLPGRGAATIVPPGTSKGHRTDGGFPKESRGLPLVPSQPSASSLVCCVELRGTTRLLDPRASDPVGARRESVVRDYLRPTVKRNCMRSQSRTRWLFRRREDPRRRSAQGWRLRLGGVQVRRRCTPVGVQRLQGLL